MSTSSASPDLSSPKPSSSDHPHKEKRDDKEKEEHRRAVEEALLGTNNVPMEGAGMYQAFALIAMGVGGSKEPLSPTATNQMASSENRATVRPITTDWTEGAVNGTHFWYEYDGSSMCALITPDKDCRSVGSRKPKVKCTACRMVIHDDCRENLSVKCRPTFREASRKKESWTQHHWVLRRKAHSSKCKECNKTLPKGPTWASNRSSKAFVAVSCSWCKDIYHTSCFKLSLIEDHCTLGDFEQIIIPPSWIVLGSKARSGGSKKGSKRKISYSTRPSSSTKRTSLRKRSDHEREDNKRPFHIKVPSSATVNRSDGSLKTPLIVFVNPKSGGNQGVYLIQAFQWLLNPRQVFDLTEGGPTAALQMFQHVPNLRILVCGGDGTVGWVLAEIDRLQFVAFPPVAVLPLGTGNDLARVLNWGGGYADEPLEKILFHVADGAIQGLDRWEINIDNMDSIECAEQQSSSPTMPVSALDDLDICKDEPQEIKQLPISVMNNYFSLGLDAYIQYQFHTNREANPEKFSSRTYNKFVYAKAGFVDTFEQKYKDLSRFLELVCDGEDLTEKIRDQKIHCLVFLNIPSYSAGAYPWGNPHTGSRTQSMDDGFIEVLGLSGAPNMAALQVGIRGVRLCQCRKATVISRRAVHTQVDGEPAYLAASVISVTRRNQARMIMKGKNNSRYSSNNQESICSLEPSIGEGVQPVKIPVHKVTYQDYNKHNGNITQLQEIALPLTMVVVRPSLGIDIVRPYVEKCVKEMKQVSRLPGCVSENWCFLHSSDGRLYPISNELESQLPVQDMVATGIFVLDIGAKGTPKLSRGSDKGTSTPVDSEEEDGIARQGKRMTPPSTSSANNIDDVLLLQLFEASKSGDIDKLKSLRESGADFTAVGHNGMTALHTACNHDKIDAVRCLVVDISSEHINRASSENSFTALHYAAQNQSMEMCQVLIENGAIVSLHDSSGKTAVLHATNSTLKEYLQSTEHYQLKADTGTPV